MVHEWLILRVWFFRSTLCGGVPELVSGARSHLPDTSGFQPLPERSFITRRQHSHRLSMCFHSLRYKKNSRSYLYHEKMLTLFDNLLNTWRITDCISTSHGLHTNLPRLGSTRVHERRVHPLSMSWAAARSSSAGSIRRLCEVHLQYRCHHPGAGSQWVHSIFHAFLKIRN